MVRGCVVHLVRRRRVSLAGHAGQARTVTDRVYADAQAARGQQIYQNAVPGLSRLGARRRGGAAAGGRRVSRGVERAPAGRSRGQDREDDAAAAVGQHLACAGHRPRGVHPARGKVSGRPDRAGAGTLGQIAFPAARAASAPARRGSASFAAAGNLAQLMRGVTFPNANILFNVQVKDPGTAKPTMPVPFDYVLWGSTVYYGWQAVDQAALALIETSPLFLLPGRRCENGRPAPVDRADWKQYTAALVDAGRAAYKASQSRNVDAVIKVAEQLNADVRQLSQGLQRRRQGRRVRRCRTMPVSGLQRTSVYWGGATIGGTGYTPMPWNEFE